MRRLALSALLFLAGCDTAPSASLVDASSDARPPCTPDLATFEADVAPRVERYCGSCHGATPDFGAPVSLLDGPALLAVRDDGTRLVDRIATRLADGSMPPAGMPRLPDDDADAIAAWASCGVVDVPIHAGLVSSAPPFLAPEHAPAGLTPVDFVVDHHPVGVDVRDEYRCFVFDADIPEERFVRRFEMVFGETRVLHHVVLLRDTERHTTPGDFDCYDGSGMPNGSQYLYAWAPGQSALEFPEGGLRVSPGERFIVQIHYNNGAGLPDVVDSSGVRLLLGPTEGPEYGMIALGPTNFSLPPRMRTQVSSQCTFRADATIVAGLPHMHVLGDELDSTITRPTGTERLIHLSGWRFDTQLFYSLPTVVRRGDVVHTRCTYDNPSDEEVPSGENTTQEMCFDFLYVTPPPADRYCDEGSAAHPTDVAYLGGECLPVGASTDVPLARGTWTVASTPPSLSQAAIPDGRWTLESIDYYVTATNTPIGTIDLDATYVLGRGQIVTGEGQIAYDVVQDTVVITESGVRLGGIGGTSFAGGLGATTSPATVVRSCPAGSGESTFDWGYDGETLTIGFESDGVPGQTLWPRFHFRRAVAPAP